jgi:hypothetical protein
MSPEQKLQLRITDLEKIIVFNYRTWERISKISGVEAVGYLRQLKANMGILCEITGEQATDVAARLGISVRMWQ